MWRFDWKQLKKYKILPANKDLLIKLTKWMHLIKNTVITKNLCQGFDNLVNEYYP